MSQPLARHMPGLDGLRGVAAAVVLIGHAIGMMLDTSFVTRGYLGVQFFWMLSGFVIAHAYQARLSSEMTISVYFWRRIVRLYPMIVASALLGVLVLLATNQHFTLTDPRALLASLGAILCLPVPAAAFAHGNFPVVTPEWSLFYELILSALFGLVLHRATTLALVAITVVAVAGYTAALNTFTAPTLPLLTYFSPALASFTLGLLLYRASPLLPALPAPFWLPAAMLVAVTCTQASWGPAFDLACLIVVLPAVILVSTGIAARGPAIRLAGDLSYPLYILHWPVLVACNTILLPRIGAVPALLSGVGLSIATAWAALRLYDEPVRAALGRRMWESVLAAAE